MPAHVPPPINDAFLEGAHCLAVGCPNAASAMFRLCLDLATKEQLPPPDDAEGPTKHERRNLAPRLKWLFTQGLLPNDLEELSKAVKDNGDDGAHEGCLDEVEAEDIYDFAYELLQRLFTHPARLAAAQQRRVGRRQTAAALAGRGKRPHLICEMIAPRREFVRQRAIISYQDNDALSLLALEAELDRVFAGPEWSTIHQEDLSEAERLDRAIEFMENRFSYTGNSGRSAGVSDLVEQLRQEVEGKHEVSCGKVHSDYGRYIGLASRRGTNRMRYAPTDALLKTLVITRVPKRLEFKRFLADLYDHYGFVFGDVEARHALDANAFDSSAFERNRARLEARLASMGMLNRLSDGCAYVINPFAQQEGR